MSIHFTARTNDETEANFERLEWFQMRLKEDFSSTLKIYGTLPIARVKTGLEERKSLVDLMNLVEHSGSWTQT